MNYLKGFASLVLGSLLVFILFILGLVVTINLTVLNPAFVVAELEKLDIYSIIIDEAKALLPNEKTYSSLDDMFTDLEPWLIEQTNNVTYDGYGHLKGDQELNIRIPLEPLKTNIKDSLKENVSDYLPPYLGEMPESLTHPILAEVYNEIDNLIPDEFVINETSLEPEMRAGLEQARQIVGYIELAYILSVVVTILLIILIALINRWHIKPTALSVGIAFTTAGLISAMVALVTRITNMATSRIAGEADIFFALQEKLPQLITDITLPLIIYGTGFVIAGIGLIVLSFITRHSRIGHSV